jgi:hypothetical protein
MPGPIRADERFQQALEDAKTAGSLQEAMVLNEGEVKCWTSKSVVLLRAIRTADDVYERELGEALDDYRKSVTGAGDGDCTDGS